ncbi:MAG: carbohydrate kinase family protein [[Clostridium] leptum]
MQVGGDAFNVASNLAALGRNSTVQRCRPISFRGFCLVCREVGCSCAVDSKNRQPNSVTAVLIHPDGERNFVVQKGASQQLREEEISDELLKAYDMIYIGSACGLPELEGESLTRLLKRAKDLGH